MAEHIDIIIDESSNLPPLKYTEFIEIEIDGRSVNIGERIELANGFTAIRISIEDIRDAWKKQDERRTEAQKNSL